MIQSSRHKITNLILPMTHDYLELLVYDVVSYLPKVLEDEGRLSIEWIIYDINKSIKGKNITLTLIERVKTQYWKW
jgi:hypothetical protein